MRSIYFLLFSILFIQTGLLAQGVDLSIEKGKYYTLSGNKQYDQSAKVAFKIGNICLESNKFDEAKNFFEKAINDSKRANLTELTSLSIYNHGISTFNYA